MSAITPNESPPGARPAIVPPRDSGGHYQPGDIIAQKYRLTQVLGEGGMGAVWLAKNVRLDADVAIKLIRHDVATAETAERLLKEARAAARIGHRSIVRVFDFGETELDDPFIVMEVLSGESLRDLLERKGRRLPAANAVRTVLPIASALVAAHAAGIVHRDLKPENIMLVPDVSGSVVPKIVDFGIAKLRRGDGGADDSTPPRFVVGTPDYMSPEQAGGREEVDEAADVWALAVILYEAISGRVPFGGPTYAALIFSIMTEDPVPTPELLAGDAALWGILQEALGKRSASRPSMRAFGTALARWAIANGVESDVAGTSLSAHWINAQNASPFSALPPPPPEGSIPDVVVPRAGSSVESSLSGTERPTMAEAPRASSGEARRSQAEPPRARGLGVAWLALTGVMGIAIVLAILRRPPPPAPVTTGAPVGAPPPASGTSLAVTARLPIAPPATASPGPAVTSDPSASVSVLPSASASAEAAGPSASASAPTAPRWIKVSPARPVRKSTLPIAKKPDF